MKIPFLKHSKRLLVIFGVVLISVAGYLFFRGDTTNTASAAIIAHQVSTGTVTTGIQTTGKIVAANTLDLNVYKLTSRIDEVSIANGTHVKEGQLLFAFDQSDVAVDIAQSQIGIREAQLSLEVEKSGVADPNTTITTLKNDIVKLENNIAQSESDIRTALRTFLNSNLEAVPTDSRYDEQVNETAPQVGGVYTHTARGEYVIQIYASGETSGYSYHLSGLESGTYPVFLGAETSLGTRGLTITFPSSGVGSRDEWVVAVPNTEAPEYSQNLEDYDDAVLTIRENTQSDTVALANKKVLLEQAERGDTTSKRELNVESAALAIDKARVDLQKGIDTRNERRIIAPFSGTVEGIENVVVGATPTKDSNDSINFGVLISDDFMTTFSLNANDVGKISLGQKVLVTLTSVPESVPLEAEIVEISSLPDSSAVAQYEVLARISVSSSASIDLREGMLADIEIVQEEKSDVVRIPVSAISYSEGKAKVTVVEGLSEQQYTQVQRMGIVRSEGTPTYTTFEKNIEIGLRGQYYVEVLSGIETGEILVVTSTTATAGDAQVVQTGFGPPGSGRMRESEEASTEPKE
jgi:multidrug efflux pump subunit AcrA (membrane-fusion protein)